MDTRLGTQKVRTVTVKNSGLSDLSGIYGQIADDLNGVLVSNCGTLTYKESCTFDVTFIPKTQGVNEAAKLLIRSNDPVNPEVVIYISGKGK
jgi:hypothetical protein